MLNDGKRTVGKNTSNKVKNHNDSIQQHLNKSGQTLKHKITLQNARYKNGLAGKTEKCSCSTPDQAMQQI